MRPGAPELYASAEASRVASHGREWPFRCKWRRQGCRQARNSKEARRRTNMNPTVKELTSDFLGQQRIAIAGVSRTDRNAPGNIIYRKLRDAGYEVFALNPHTAVAENDPCYSNLKALPRKVDAIVIATAPETATKLLRECAEAGVSRVWLHRSFGAGSVSREAEEFCRDHQMTVIAGGCPMMFCQPVDWAHRCMRWVLAATGGLPK